MNIRQYMQRLLDREDDPYGLTGKRDDTMEMLLAMMNQQDVPAEWGVEPQAPPPPAVEPGPRPGDGSWEEFQAMNPNLDYDAVAQQSGGNVPGGNFSAMESSVTYEPTEMDKQLFDYVQNQIPRDEIARKQDPRSRAYDPGGAEQMIAMIKQDQEASAMSAESKIREVQNEIAMREVKAYETLANQGLTKGGYPFAGGGAKSQDPLMNPKTYEELAILAKQAMSSGGEYGAELTPEESKAVTELNTMVMLAKEGRFDEARAIWDKYSPAAQGAGEQQQDGGGEWSERNNGVPALRLN